MCYVLSAFLILYWTCSMNFEHSAFAVGLLITSGLFAIAGAIKNKK